MDKQREAFEKWIISQRGNDVNLSPAVTNVGIITDDYRQIRVQAKWEGWQAAQADKLEYTKELARKVADKIYSATVCSTVVDMYGSLSFNEVDINSIIAKVLEEKEKEDQ